jgi:hypothetical protein
VFVFTVGQYKAPAFAQPRNSPNYIGSILSNSAHITTFTGLPFIQYNIGGDYLIRFETLDFRNPPQVFTVQLHFEKCCPWYYEDEPLKIIIINSPPFLISRPDNASYYAGSTFFYTLPMAVDPEMGPVFIKVVSNLLPFVSHSGGLNFSI